MEDLTPLTALQSGSKMSTERQPLLTSRNDKEFDQGRIVARPDVRSSPDNGLIDVQSDESLGSGSMESVMENKPDYNPSMHRALEHPTSNFDTMIHLLKGNIGTGILAMPDAFKNSGLYLGLFGTLIMGGICTHCMHMLVNCSHELCRRIHVPALSFSDAAYTSFDTGPMGLRKYAGVAKKSINLFLFITQIGFCCVYFLFVALNIKEVIGHYFIKLDVRVYLLLMLFPMIPLNLVKSLKYLTPISFFAALLTATGLAITFYYMLQDLPSTDTVKPIASWAQLPLYFGTAIYAFEGIGVILPLENNMRNPEDFGGWTGVLNTGMVIVACLYTAVGFFGYLKYGENVKGSITLNLPDGAILSQLVRTMMAIAIFLSYTLQFYVPVNIAAPYLRSQFESEHERKIAEVVLRISLVIFTFVLAIAIPNLNAIISLVGAVSSSTLALIAPPIIEIVTYYQMGYGKFKWILWKDITILIFGLSGFAFGTYASLAQILNPSID